MCLQIEIAFSVPEQTQRVARAAFPKGNFYLRMRDELGTPFTDQDFVALYPKRGQPGIAPWRLALVTVMQFIENLSDRQAAEAVRARIDWKYAMGLELTDPGFNFSVLSEFRDRLINNNAEAMLLDRMLQCFGDKKLLKARGCQRMDSTHVLAAIRVMNRLELVIETLRATLNELAQRKPDWLRALAPTQWYSRYNLRAEQFRLPQGDKARRDYAEQVGKDGAMLLAALKQHKPECLTLPCVQTLQQVWECHYVSSEDGSTQWRPESQLPAPQQPSSPLMMPKPATAPSVNSAGRGTKCISRKPVIPNCPTWSPMSIQRWRRYRT